MVLLVKIRCARGDVLPALGASVPRVQDAFFMRLSYLAKWRPLYDKISPSVGAKNGCRSRHTIDEEKKLPLNTSPELKLGTVGQQFYDTAAGAIRDFTTIHEGEVSVYYRSEEHTSELQSR